MRGADIVVVDEVGKLEAHGDGWAPYITKLLPLEVGMFVLIARLDCMRRICDRFGLLKSPRINVQAPHSLGRLHAAAQKMLMYQICTLFCSMHTFLRTTLESV